MEFVHVIVPIKLGWEPVYSIPDGMTANVGDRVKVQVSGREYIGVVHDFIKTADIPQARILPLLENCSSKKEKMLPPILPTELSLWEFVADYYMCTIGEVYKAAYTAARVKTETSKSRRRAAPPTPQLPRCNRQKDVNICRQIYDIFAEGRPALLAAPAPDSARIAGILAQRTAEEGKSVLVLSPDTASVPEGCLQYNSSTSPAARRDLAIRLRSGEPCIIYGTRASVFLPFASLGMVIILDEHSGSYKQSEPSPRYNGRDSAVKLAAIHRADILLCSNLPSLESLANCDSGKYRLVTAEAKQEARTEFEIIDTTAERRKNGMTGNLSRKLTAQMSEALGQKLRVALILPWKDTDDIEIEARELFPQARTRLAVMSLKDSRNRSLEKYSLVALLCAEFLLKGQDFRADEKSLRELVELSGKTESKLVIQASDAAHPVLRAAFAANNRLETLRSMMPLREKFRLPPYTRAVDIVFKDNNDARRLKMIRELSESLPSGVATPGSIRVLLVKDRNIQNVKHIIEKTVSEFEKSRNYRGHILFDVDPF